MEQFLSNGEEIVGNKFWKVLKILHRGYENTFWQFRLGDERVYPEKKIFQKLNDNIILINKE